MTPQLLPDDRVGEFVSTFFNRKQIFLDAVRQFGSPLYLLETDVLKARAEAFRAAFEKKLPRTFFYYAMKSNNLPYISRVILEQGFGIDVSSGLELAVAVDLNAKDIIFSGPGKTDPELEKAVDHADAVTVLIDSAGELVRLKSILSRRKKSLRVGIRLNSNPEGLWRKFGIGLEELGAMYEQIADFPYLQFKGLQFHSSWNLDPARQVAFIDILADQLEKMSGDFLQELEFIDIGGGYWPTQGEWLLSETPYVYHLNPAESIETFAEELSQKIKERIFPLVGCRICFEPGRWICNDAMHILMTVVDAKARDLVITDAGTNTIGWERFEIDYFPVLNLSNDSMKEIPCHILGALCTPHDVWGYACFGKNIGQDDVLMIPTQGAYTYSLRQQFIKPLPQVVILDQKQNLQALSMDPGKQNY